MEYQILEGREAKQDANIEERDETGRILRPQRASKDEVILTVRQDWQFTARVALDRQAFEGADRNREIADSLSRVRLGQEIAPSIQVIEYEYQFTPAQDAKVFQDRPEDFIPALPSRVEHIFTLRLGGNDIQKVSLTDKELKLRGWTTVLAGKANSRSVGFTR